LPLAAGLISLFLFRSLSRRVLPPAAALLALALFAFNRWLVFYSTDVKQYSSDVLVSTGLLLAAIRCLDERLGRRRAFLLALAGAAAGLLSYTALLMSAAILAAAFLAFLVRRDRQTGTLAAIASFWAAGSAASVAWSLRSTAPADREFLHRYWLKHGGMPALGDGAAGVARWLARTMREAFESLADPAFLPDRAEWVLGIGLALAAAAGLAWLWRSRPIAAALLALPVLTALGSAVAQRYPFSGRLVLFLFPCLLVLVAAGFAWASSLRFAGIRAASSAAGAALVLLFALRAISILPEHFEELRPVLEQVSARPREGGPVSYWLYSSAEKAFRYYERRIPLPVGDATYVCRAPDYWPHYISEIAAADRGRKVWVVLSHLDDEEAEFIRRSFSVFGTREAEFRDEGASASLYVLRAPDPAAIEALDRSIPAAKRGEKRACDEDARRHGSRPVGVADPGR
jgi:hypothetical protein